MKNPCDYILEAVDGTKSDEENILAMCDRVKRVISEAAPEEIAIWWGGLKFDFEKKAAIVNLVFPSQPPQSQQE